MTCPHCAAHAAVVNGRCTACRRAVADSWSATGVLTALPDRISPPGFEDDAPTLLSGTDTAARPQEDTRRPPSADDGPTLAPATASRTSGMHVDTGSFTRLEDGSRPAPASPGGGPLEIGQRFGPRYHIVRLLGIGGMGAVYQAWDAELDVIVALKVIRPEATSDPEQARAIERRFKQELLLARQVTHRNVVRIHDLGEIDGIKYITMSYIDGDDLATVLKRAGRLPVREALQIARQMASGLLAAHEAGVVHRDLKPANIMIEGGNAVIMDFGIARSVSAPRPELAGAGTLTPGAWRQMRHAQAGTLAGTTVGTIAYMAPEQASGGAADQRADMYALGLILYDMLLGRRPRAEHLTPFEELQRRMHEAPAPLRTVDPSIPGALEAIVSRCLQPDAAARFQTTAELVAAFDRLNAQGEPLPLVRRVTRRMVVALAIVVIASLAGTYYLTRRAVETLPTPDSVSVVIADIENRTGDPAFDRTLEPMLRRALEGAGFITAYDRSRVRGLGVAQPDTLDAVAARELAVQQGLGVVLAGAIAPQGNGFRLSVRATRAVSDEVVVATEDRASDKDDVLDVATRLIARIRSALGDPMSESAQQFAMGSVSATSLDVVRHYAAGLEAASKTRFAEARDHALKAVELDPNFGIGYLLLASTSRNLGLLDDDRKYLAEALSHLGGMTDRERLSTRGYSYWVARDYEGCVKEYRDLVRRYPSDVGGHNQLALCLSHLRQLRPAMEEMRRVVAILPSHPLFRHNLALYAGYASDFETAEREAAAIKDPDPNAVLALAFAQLGQNRLADAKATYERLQRMSPQAASAAASGLGDLATLEGRFGDAVRILRRAVPADLAAGNRQAAASKLAAIAYAELSRERFGPATAAATEALAHSDAANIKFLAGRTLVEAGEVEPARALAEALGNELYPEPRAHGKILEGMLALRAGDSRVAIGLIREANEIFDTWIGHFELGRAFLAAGQPVQADSEFDDCLNTRRGEALSLFVDEEPTYAYVAHASYHLARGRQAIGDQRYAELYKTYLTLRGSSPDDRLVPEIRRALDSR